LENYWNKGKEIRKNENSIEKCREIRKEKSSHHGSPRYSGTDQQGIKIPYHGKKYSYKL
jgi:hypothetical protein